MFSLTFSAKRVGVAHSVSFGSSRAPGSIFVKFLKALWLAPLFSLLLFAIRAAGEPPKPGITRAAADQCNLKLKSLEDFASHRKAGQKRITRFSQNEVNSYLSLDLRSHYHPSLKDLSCTFEEDMLECIATVNFDHLGSTSSRLLPKLLSLMISGVHLVTARGRIVSGNGKARFQLVQARFDNSTLPRSLVEEIISAVGRKQKPPFDPLQASELFDDIDRVEVHMGYILVFQ
jgi:hypothetical protein